MARNPQTTYWEIVKKTLRLFGMTAQKADVTVRKERQRLQEVLLPDMQDVIYHDDPFKVAVRLDGGESTQEYVDYIGGYREIVHQFNPVTSTPTTVSRPERAGGILLQSSRRNETENRHDRRSLKPRNS
jgi:hypothetical protein